MREFFTNIFEQKFYLMFITAVIYIMGLVGFFQGYGVLNLGIITLIFIILIYKNLLSPKLALIWVFVFLLGFFNAYLRIKSSDELSHLAPQTTTIKGQIVTIPDTGLQNRTRFFFNVNQINFNNENINTNSKTFVTLDGIHNLKIGDYYEISGKLRTSFSVSNPSQFDYSKYLKNFGVHTTFYSDNAKFLSSPKTTKWKFLQELNDIRTTILSYHAQNIKSPNIEILGGIVFGDDAVSPPDNIKKSFINAGILHILAASGMNVALIYGIFFFILSKLKIPFKINIIIGIVTVALYTLMTGMGPSVIRASIILIFILIGKLIDRDAHSLSLLSFVALLMLICNPAYINDVGFQLSFIVTFGLLVMTQPVFEKVKFMPNWLSGTIFIPIIAQLWVAPIQMFYFNTFCLYSIFANILILPFITIISFGGFISSVLALIKPLAPYICFIFDTVLNPFISAVVLISDFFGNLHNALITMPKPSFLQMFLYYIFLLIFTKLIKDGLNKKWLTALCTVILLICFSAINISKSSELIFFDVENADCMLYKTPENKYFIIDTGKMGFKGRKNQVNYILMEYLKDKGIRNIEGLILTHYDSDHAGGAEDLIKNFKIKKVYVNSLNNNSNIAKRIFSLTSDIEKGINNNTIYRGKNLEIKTFIADLEGDKFENENSLITLIKENNYNILLMGDAGITGFEKIEKDLPEKIDVLKVGHHGAKNVINDKMLERLSPQYSIISTGINKFGHPNPVTLDILSPTTILRTDRNNAVKIKDKKLYVFDSQKGFIKYER